MDSCWSNGDNLEGDVHETNTALFSPTVWHLSHCAVLGAFLDDADLELIA